LRSNGFLELRPPGDPRIAEDVTFALLVRACGLAVPELGGDARPLALAWRGLPEPPRELIRLGKKATHSVKFAPADLKVRDYFARVRAQACAATGRRREHARALRISRALRRRMRWPGVAARALDHRHLAAARRLYAWLAWDRPLRGGLWVRLALSCLPRSVLDALEQARRIATRSVPRPGTARGRVGAEE
jgi:hypothetical protein